MAQYVLVLRDNGRSFEGISAEEMQQIVGRYRDWSGKLGGQGKLAGGQKLRDKQGRVMTKNGNGISVNDGPFAETKEIIGGYFILEAGSYDEALALAKDCPHLDFGSIEVREIEIMS